MADIRKILNRCNIKRFGYLHENIVQVEQKKGYGVLKINTDPQTASSMMAAAMGKKLPEAVLMIVVDPEEYNKAFEEVKTEEAASKC